jgi:hypothetical protein
MVRVLRLVDFFFFGRERWGGELTFGLDRCYIICLIWPPINVPSPSSDHPLIALGSSSYHRILITIPPPTHPHLLRPTHLSSGKPPIHPKIETAQAYPPSQAQHQTLPPLHTLPRHPHLESARRTGLRSSSEGLTFSPSPVRKRPRDKLKVKVMVLQRARRGWSWIRTKRLSRTSIDGGPS